MLTPEMTHNIWKPYCHIQPSPLLVETELDTPLNSAQKFLQGCIDDYDENQQIISF